MDFTWNQAKAAGKHVASFAAGGVAIALYTHVISDKTGGDLTNDINNITTGVQKIAEGIAGIVAILVPIYTALKAGHNASPVMQAQSLVKEVPGTTVITSQKIADATPNVPDIVSNTETKVVSK